MLAKQTAAKLSKLSIANLIKNQALGVNMDIGLSHSFEKQVKKITKYERNYF